MKSILSCVILLVLLTIPLQAQENFQEPQTYKVNTIGAGLGIQYGVLGVNVDINVAPNLNLTGGIGTAIVGLGWNIGAKYFFLDVSKSFRPRVMALYGVNSVLQVVNASSYDKSYTGLSIGVGAQYMWGESRTSGIDFDIMFLATTGFDVNELRNSGIIVDEPGKVKISIGYRHTL